VRHAAVVTAASAPPPNVLSIAGSDPGGGAGVQADLRTFAAFGVYGTAVPTALTAQSTRGVAGVFVVPPAVVRRQLEVLFDDVAFDAVKIGMLGDAATVRVVADVLRRARQPVVVLDPVIRASSGAPLLSPDGVEALRAELLPLVDVCTPNVAEAAVLLAAEPPETPDGAAALAMALARRGPRHVVLTGGHLRENDTVCVDTLADGERAQHLVAVRRAGRATHGTGCTYASALAALLASGRPLVEACRAAQAFVGASIVGGSQLRVGHGRGPVWQLHAPVARAGRRWPVTLHLDALPHAPSDAGPRAPG